MTSTHQTGTADEVAEPRAPPREDEAAPAPHETSTSMEVASPPPDADDGQLKCYVCFESTSERKNELHTGICECSTNGIHTECLEKLLNTKRCRSRPLDARMTCSVCASRYTIGLARYVVHAPPPTAFDRFRASKLGGQYLPLFFALCLSGIFGILMWRVGRLLTLLIMGIFIVVLVGLYALLKLREGDNDTDPQALSDSRFFEEIVELAKRELASGYTAPAAGAGETASLATVLVVQPRGAPAQAHRATPDLDSVQLTIPDDHPAPTSEGKPAQDQSAAQPPAADDVEAGLPTARPTSKAQIEPLHTAS